ncbi:MAG: M15 family metallopeptidase [Bacteroidetes bacterium]|nr:M15 family metallopeptidase [Bacteroidota bacterium]
MKWSFIVLIIVLQCCSCDYSHRQNNNSKEIVKVSIDTPSISRKTDSINLSLSLQSSLIYTATEQHIIDAGLTDIKTIDSNIVVDLKYSTDDNFLGFDIYGAFNKCYLQPDVAKKLKGAQLLLKSRFPYYNLIVYDAVRPLRIQYKMWDNIKVPYTERSKYLSNPKNGSLHNFGAAVDLSIIDENEYDLDMGTPYDYFGELAYPREEERMIKEGKLTRLQLLNRKILRDVMQEAGFMGITTEWWHFNSCSRNEAFSKYKIIE